MDRPMNYVIPTVTEMTHRGERSYDIWSRLLVDRIVFLGTEINDQVANVIIAQLLFLDSQDPDKDIQLYINSPGGVWSVPDPVEFEWPDPEMDAAASAGIQNDRLDGAGGAGGGAVRQGHRRPGRGLPRRTGCAP